MTDSDLPAAFRPKRRRFGSRRTLAVRSALVAAVAVATVATTTTGQPQIANAAPIGDTAPSRLHPLQPCRLFDSRTENGGRDKVSEATVEVDVAGKCGVPTSALAGSFTVTVTGTENGAGHATIYPAGTELPTASNLNWSTDRTTQANGALIKLGNGKVRVRVRGTAHLVVDVYGYFDRVDSTSAGRLVSVTPRRILDTRAGASFDSQIPAFGRWGANTDRRIPLPTGVPTDAIALSVNITTSRSNGGGYFTTYLPGTERPTASLLNTDAARQTRASSAIVPVDERGFMLFSNRGGEVIVDLNGYFTGPSASDESVGLFVARQPTRILDTRPSSPVSSGGIVGVDTTALTGDVSATVANITVVRPSDPGFVAVFPKGFAVPRISSVNVDQSLSATANIAITPTAADGIGVYAARLTDVIVDVTGYFTGAPYDGPEPPDPSRIVDTRVIGKTVSGRPITAYRLGTPGGTVVIAATMIHGDETEAQRVTDYLLNHAEIPEELDVWIVPVANPDGAAALARTNGRGVDLNRNFATVDWQYQGVGTTRYSGPTAASEPETVALQRFVLEVQPKLVVWWHQVGNHVDDQPLVANYSLLVRFAELTQMPIKDTYCNPSPCRGTATRYINDQIAGASSFVVELPTVVTPALAKLHADAFLQIAALA